ncbi:MAG: glycosyltransferase [Anaerolineae bacterium]|nr:glycosyltransferase [Anaerolineae bacterium]
MTEHSGDFGQPHLIWGYATPLAERLDAATWLYTTRELRQMGWRVTLVCYGAAECRQIHGVEVHCIPTPSTSLFRQVIFHLRFLKLVLRQWDSVDVILFHAMSTPWVLPLCLLRWLTRQDRPLIAMDIRTLHMIPSDRESIKDRLRKHCRNFMALLARRWADGLLVITQQMADALNLSSGDLWGIWPSGVDIDLFSKAVDLRHWPEPDEPVKLIYIGSLNYERNLMTLGKAIVQANASGMRFELLLVGSGMEEDDLRTFANTTAGTIRVEPPVPHDKVPYKLAKAHVGVLPFPDEEKFRVSNFIKLFEYMAAGLPMLATRIVAHTSVITGDSYVIWANGSDEQALVSGLRALWNERENLQEMGQHASRAAHQWTWHESAKKLKTALETGLKRYPIKERG